MSHWTFWPVRACLFKSPDEHQLHTETKMLENHFYLTCEVGSAQDWGGVAWLSQGCLLAKLQLSDVDWLILNLHRNVVQRRENEKVEGDSCRFLCICWKRKQGISVLDTNPATATTTYCLQLYSCERCSAIIKEHIKLPLGCTFSSAVLTQLECNVSCLVASGFHLWCYLLRQW